jgi:hypothetical protein
MLADHGRKRSAGGIAANDEPFRIDAKRGRVSRHERGRRNRVLDRCGKPVLRREPIVDRDQAAAGRVGQRGRDPVMGLDAARHHAAAMEEHEAGQRRVLAGRRIQAIADVAAGTRQHAVGGGDPGCIGARKLHQLRQRLPALGCRRPRAGGGRGRGHHGEETFGQGVERHDGSG